ncbi:MAG: head decoration protein [Cognaticolwellia aestuarii]
MQAQTMGPRNGGFILSEAGSISFEEKNVIGGQYLAGTVLSKKSNGDFTQVNPTATGSEKTAVAVLIATTDATEAVNKTVLARLSEVDTKKLVWPEGITNAQTQTALTQLAANNIIAR